MMAVLEKEYALQATPTGLILAETAAVTLILAAANANGLLVHVQMKATAKLERYSA